MGKLPDCVGVPLNTPAADKVRPVGKVLTVLNVTGNTPPLCVKVWLNNVPTVPVVVAGLVTVITGQVLITKLYNAPFAKHPLASVAFTMIGKGPVCNGVPANTPAVDKVIPLGNGLAEVNVTAPIPPADVKVWLKGTLSWPVVTTGSVTDIAWQLITKLYSGLVPVQPLPSVTTTVIG